MNSIFTLNQTVYIVDKRMLTFGSKAKIVSFETDGKVTVDFENGFVGGYFPNQLSLNKPNISQIVILNLLKEHNNGKVVFNITKHFKFKDDVDRYIVNDCDLFKKDFGKILNEGESFVVYLFSPTEEIIKQKFFEMIEEMKKELNFKISQYQNCLTSVDSIDISKKIKQI